MRIKITALTAVLITSNAFAQIAPQTPPMGLPAPSSMPLLAQPPSDYANLEFNSVTVSNLITIIFSEVQPKSFVLSSKVLQDNRVVSFRYNKKQNGEIINFLSSFLKSLDLQMTSKNGVYYVDVIPEKQAEDYSYYVYEPKYRNANYLVDNLRPFFGENFLSSVRNIATDHKATQDNVSPTSAYAMMDKSQQLLSFRYENEKLKNKILNFIKQLDTPESNLIVKSYIYEVQYNENDGSALGLLVKLANGKLTLNTGSSDPLSNFVKFSSNSLNLFLSDLSKNTDIKLLSNPVLRIKNGKESVLTVGNSVPTLGNVSYTQQGQPIQNVEYKDTGLVLKLNPTITKESISLDLTQEISEAIATSNGVNNTPTLTKRNLSTTFTTKKNEVVMLAGLTQTKQENGKSRSVIFPFFENKIKENSKTDIVVFLEVVDLSEQQIPSDFGVTQ